MNVEDSWIIFKAFKDSVFMDFRLQDIEKARSSKDFQPSVDIHHHIRFWYLRCCGCPGLRGRQLRGRQCTVQCPVRIPNR